jgi:hypothetical protein
VVYGFKNSKRRIPMKRSELDGMTLWVCRECGEDSICFRSGFGGTLPCLYPGNGFPKPAWREETIEDEPDLQEHVSDIEVRLSEIEKGGMGELLAELKEEVSYIDRRLSEHIASDRIDDGSEQFEDATSDVGVELVEEECRGPDSGENETQRETHGQKVIRTLKAFVQGLEEHGLGYLDGRMLPPIQYDPQDVAFPAEEKPPMPDGYLVLPEPSGKPITETMMVARSYRDGGEYRKFNPDAVGMPLSTRKEGEIIDIAENVLPPLPDTHELVKWEFGRGHKLEPEDYVWSARLADWVQTHTERFGDPVVAMDTNQHYFGRLKAVKGENNEP